MYIHIYICVRNPKINFYGNGNVKQKRFIKVRIPVKKKKKKRLSRVRWSQGNPSRPARSENLLTRPGLSRDISNSSGSDRTRPASFENLLIRPVGRTTTREKPWFFVFRHDSRHIYGSLGPYNLFGSSEGGKRGSRKICALRRYE